MQGAEDYIDGLVQKCRQLAYEQFQKDLAGLLPAVRLQFRYCENSWRRYLRLKITDPNSALVNLFLAVLVSMQFKLHHNRNDQFEQKSAKIKAWMLSVESEIENIKSRMAKNVMFVSDTPRGKSSPKAKLHLHVQFKPEIADKSFTGNKLSRYYVPEKEGDVPFGKFIEFEILGDGSCAFRAIVQGLRNGLLDADHEDLSAKKLRKWTCDQLIAKKERNICREINMTVHDRLKLEHNQATFNFEAYVEKMRRGAYAGETELLLIAFGLNKQISVYSKRIADEKYKHLITYGKSGQRIFLRFIDGKSRAGDHYELLVPVKESNNNKRQSSVAGRLGSKVSHMFRGKGSKLTRAFRKGSKNKPKESSSSLLASTSSNGNNNNKRSDRDEKPLASPRPNDNNKSKLGPSHRALSWKGGRQEQFPSF